MLRYGQSFDTLLPMMQGRNRGSIPTLDNFVFEDARAMSSLRRHPIQPLSNVACSTGLTLSI